MLDSIRLEVSSEERGICSLTPSYTSACSIGLLESVPAKSWAQTGETPCCIFKPNMGVRIGLRAPLLVLLPPRPGPPPFHLLSALSLPRSASTVPFHLPLPVQLGTSLYNQPMQNQQGSTGLPTGAVYSWGGTRVPCATLVTPPVRQLRMGLSITAMVWPVAWPAQWPEDTFFYLPLMGRLGTSSTIGYSPHFGTAMAPLAVVGDCASKQPREQAGPYLGLLQVSLAGLPQGCRRLLLQFLKSHTEHNPKQHWVGKAGCPVPHPTLLRSG